MSVGWGIVGIGRHADRFMAPAIGHAHNARLVAVYSRDQGRSDAFAAKHGAERAYDDLDRMLADPAVDVIYIGSPSAIHAEQAIKAARAGVHILCDKPLATTVDDAQAMIEAADTAKVILASGYNQRYHAPHVEIYNRIQAGEYGAPVLARAQCSSWVPAKALDAMRQNPDNTGPLLAIGTHVIDLLRWFIGSEVVQVAAIIEPGPDGGPEEAAIAVLKFANGATAHLDCSMKLPWPENALALHASHGFIRTEGTIAFDVGGTVHFNHRGNRESISYTPDYPGHTNFVPEIEHIGTIVREGGTPRATGLDGLEGVRVATAVREAGATGKTVTIRR